jgi:hypothetical protein
MKKGNKAIKIGIKWLGLLLRTVGVSYSNLGPETGYPDRFLWFSSVRPDNSGITP